MVGLGHGIRDEPPPRWVEVTVLGPLHGRKPANAVFPQGGSWEIDPDSLALFYVAVNAYPTLSGEELLAAQDRLKDRLAPVVLSVDGELVEFQGVSEGPHWGAIHRGATDHAIVVGASHISPDAVRLVEVSTLDAYTADEPPSS